MKNDWWGERSIAVLGDSISFGVGASDPLPENSYISYVKKAVQAAERGRMNYGFVSAYPTSWQPNNHAHEIHLWPFRSETDGETDWVCDSNEDGRRLISVGMTAIRRGAQLCYSLREPYRERYPYACVYYHTEPGGGSFALPSGEIVTTNNPVHETKRTARFSLAACEDGVIDIRVTSDGKPVTITGIGYYCDLSADTLTFNSYTRGGISLINMSETVLRQAASSQTLLLGIGYNDAFFNYARVRNGEFAAQIDRLIGIIGEYDTALYINDYAWRNPQVFAAGTHTDEQIALIEDTVTYVKGELHRLAAATGGIYIDQQALLGEAILADLNSDKADGAHPTSAGHKRIAQNIVSAMGLTWTEEWL